MCGVDVCDWLYGCKCVECMYTYVSLWVINDKKVSTSSGDAGAHRRGRWTGGIETCVRGIETRGW